MYVCMYVCMYVGECGDVIYIGRFGGSTPKLRATGLLCLFICGLLRLDLLQQITPKGKDLTSLMRERNRCISLFAISIIYYDDYNYD